LTQYFSAVVTAGDVRAGKPAPDIFLKAAELMGVKSDVCWVIEDSKPGIAAGLAAQMRVIAITNTHSATELAHATHVVRTYAEIERLLLWALKATSRNLLLALVGLGACGWAVMRVLTAAPQVSTDSKLLLRPGLSPQDRISLVWNRSDLNQALSIYAELTGRKPAVSAPIQFLEDLDDRLGNRLSGWGIFKRSKALPSGIQFHRDGLLGVGEVKEGCEALFAAHALRVVQDGQARFLLVHVPEPVDLRPAR
jgi:hypothetical protein